MSLLFCNTTLLQFVVNEINIIFSVCSEMEELWEHALEVLDDHDVSELYKFRDETGVLVNTCNGISVFMNKDKDLNFTSSEMRQEFW